MFEKYKISFWNYHASPLMDEKMVDTMYEAGMTQFMSPEHWGDEKGLQNMYSILKRARELAMSVIIFDHRLMVHTYLSDGEEAYVKNLKKAYGEYKDYADVIDCFLLQDEPETKECFDACYRTSQLICETFGRNKAFVSLNHVGMHPRAEGKRRIDDVIKHTEMKGLLYNCYSQCMAEKSDKQQGLNNYFNNLKLYTDACFKAGREVGQSLILSGHLMLRKPSQSDLRWQLNVGAAHGVKEFIWFHPIELNYDSPDYVGHILDCEFHKTAYFLPLAYENKRFMNTIASRLCDYKLEKVYHYFTQYGEFPLFYKGCDEIIENIENSYNRPLIVSRFVHWKDKSKQLIMVVNNSQEEIANFSIEFVGALSKFNTSAYLAVGSAKLIEIEL